MPVVDLFMPAASRTHRAILVRFSSFGGASIVKRERFRSSAAVVAVCAAVVLGLIAEFSHAESSWWERLRGVFGQDPSPALSGAEIADGLREALQVGTVNVVAQLGREDGFNLDPDIRIPLPRQLERARNLLARVGMDDTLNDLEVRLNRAAELAGRRLRA
jgi:hypothetical protein